MLAPPGFSLLGCNGSDSPQRSRTLSQDPLLQSLLRVSLDVCSLAISSKQTLVKGKLYLHVESKGKNLEVKFPTESVSPGRALTARVRKCQECRMEPGIRL